MIDPDLILVAEDRAGEVVGMLISLPDLWQARPAGARPTRARLLSIAVGRGWRGRGAALAMAAELASRLIDRGYQVLEGSWIRRDNVAPQRLARLVGGVPTRTIAYYRRDVRGRIAG